MKSQKINFYFVLYLIAVVSGFVAIQERDDGKKKTRKIIEDLITVYRTPPHIVANDEYSFNLKTKDDVGVIHVSQTGGILSNFDKVQYTCESIVTPPRAQWSALNVDIDPSMPGDGHLSLPLSGAMAGSIKVTLKVRRVVPESYPADVRNELQDSINAIDNGWFTVSKTIHVNSIFQEKQNLKIITTGRHERTIH